ncbi:MAG: family 43 glycosylhydrolase [Chitinivibrionales bacterium]|nr:family 43 glycosylhydrolase [Chitinivibrionales bacterium]MBD3358321.1 family 43 glycosylhydrolase [Chitinivibrionales bacterium]
MYTADPSAHVFDGKLFVYPSHDIPDCPSGAGKHNFCMADYHCFSTVDLMDWTDHGMILHQDDVPRAGGDYTMWAPDCAKKDLTYYFYFPTRNQDSLFRIGVATSSRPEGPFVPKSLPIAGANSTDPCIFIDDDGTPYLFWGGGGAIAIMQLESDMKTSIESTKVITSTAMEFTTSGYVSGESAV